MRYNSITYPDVNNGLGFRVVLWISGCSHHCPGCHNKETWNFMSGKPFTEEVKTKLFELLSLEYIKGITFSGGDPIDSYDDLILLVREIKEKFPDKDIWLYSGYTIEQIRDKGYNEIIELTDYLVDGEYRQELRDLSLPFRGSSNQRIFKKGKLFDC